MSCYGVARRSRSLKCGGSLMRFPLRRLTSIEYFLCRADIKSDFGHQVYLIELFGWWCRLFNRWPPFTSVVAVASGQSSSNGAPKRRGQSNQAGRHRKSSEPPNAAASAPFGKETGAKGCQNFERHLVGVHNYVDAIQRFDYCEGFYNSWHRPLQLRWVHLCWMNLRRFFRRESAVYHRYWKVIHSGLGY